MALQYFRRLIDQLPGGYLGALTGAEVVPAKRGASTGWVKTDDIAALARSYADAILTQTVTDLSGGTVTGGTSNDYTLAAARTALVADGYSIAFTADRTNTGPATLNVTPNGGTAAGAKWLVKAGGTALIAGDIVANAIYQATYDVTTDLLYLREGNAIAGLAPVNSPALSGVPTTPTAAAEANSTQIASTAYSDRAAALRMGANIANGKLVWTVASNALTVSVKTLAGADPSASDPVWVRIRDAVDTTDAGAFIKITAALSHTIANGSSLGTSANVAFKLWALIINDGGTPRIGIINTVSGKTIAPLCGWGSTTGTSGSGNFAQTIYSSASFSLKPFALIGNARWPNGLPTAGQWSAAPGCVELVKTGVSLPGTIVQTRHALFSALQTGTTVIPFDDTIPQITEGDQYASVGLTPAQETSLLEIGASVFLASSVNQNCLGAAIFRDLTTDAVAHGVANGVGVVNAVVCAQPMTVLLAGSTAATTFTLRGGGDQAGTTTVNGSGGARKYGGALTSRLSVKEIIA